MDPLKGDISHGLVSPHSIHWFQLWFSNGFPYHYHDYHDYHDYLPPVPPILKILIWDDESNPDVVKQTNHGNSEEFGQIPQSTNHIPISTNHNQSYLLLNLQVIGILWFEYHFPSYPNKIYKLHYIM